MKRTGFKRPKIARKKSVPIAMREQRGTYTAVTDVVTAAPKSRAVRSEALREAYRHIPCQWPMGECAWDGICGAVDGTVACAHSNWAEHGKAGRRKADDNRAAALCWKHHRELDQGSRLSGAERYRRWTIAHRRSVLLMVSMGLWPKDVPQPEMDDGMV